MKYTKELTKKILLCLNKLLYKINYIKHKKVIYIQINIYNIHEGNLHLKN